MLRRRGLLVAGALVLCTTTISLASADTGRAAAQKSTSHQSQRSDATSDQGCLGLNPYSATSDELSACGDITYPLTSVTPDPVAGDAVTDYNYDINGRVNTLTVPASTFDALTASQPVLSILGIPPRPSESAASYQQWVDTWGQDTSSSWVSPPPYLVIDTNFPAFATKNKTWAGYYDTANGGGFTDSEATWVEPTPGFPCSGALTVYWAGLGGVSTKYVEQAGTEQGISLGAAEDEAWYEYAPANSVLIDLYANEGKSFSSNEQFVQIPGGWDITWDVENDYTRKMESGGEVNSSYDISSAEAIAEAPDASDIVDFGDLTFTAWDAGGGYHSGDGSYGDPAAYDLYNSSETTEEVEPIYYSGNSGSYSSWTDEYLRCS